MELLPTIKRALFWLRFLPANETISRMQFIKYASFQLFICLILLYFGVSSVVYFWTNISDNLERSLYALYQINGLAITACAATYAVLLKKKIYNILNDLKIIYRLCENSDFFHYLLRANKFSEWLCKMYYIYGIGGYCVNIVLGSVFSVLLCLFSHGTVEIDKLYLPFKLSTTWDTSTEFGYGLEVFNSILISGAVLFPIATIHMLFIATGLHHKAFYKIFSQSVRKLNHLDEDRDREKHIADMIQFYIRAKDWFLETSMAYSGFVLIELCCSVIAAACLVLQLDLLINRNGINLEISFFVISAVFFLGYLFLYCFLGKMSSDCYANMADRLYECKWNDLPIRLQKHIIVMIQNAQQPIYYTGYGVVVLNLETFCKLVKAIFSYYMIFKTMTSV